MFAMGKREQIERADRIKSGWPPPFSRVVGACAGLYRLARVGMKVSAGSSFAPDQCAAAAALARYLRNAVTASAVLPFDSTAAS